MATSSLVSGQLKPEGAQHERALCLSEIRALIFDVDGVLVTGHMEKGGLWQVDMEADLSLNPDDFHRAFFEPHWADIVLGRVGIEERLAPVLNEIAPHLSVEAVLSYWFETDSRLDSTLLSMVERLRGATNLGFYLATNQEHRRADYFWRTMELEHRFDAIHYSADIGHQKPSVDFYVEVENRLGFDGAALLFFDDQEKNVVAAQDRDWNAHIWKGPETLERVLLAHGL